MAVSPARRGGERELRFPLQPPVQDPPPRASEASLERMVTLAFAPIHKRALGVAVGVAAALLLVVLSLVDLARDVDDRFPLGLLGVYFRGYGQTPVGLLAGAAWAFGVGFVAGWFAAFMRNVSLAVVVVVTRARLNLRQGHDLLDHL